MIVRRYWRALGFASAADDAVAFTDADIGALGDVQSMVAALDLTDEEMIRLIRAIGRTTARLAEWVTEEYLEWSRARGVDPAAGAGLSALGATGEPSQRDALASALPQLDEMVLYAFRRQLAAAVGRALDVPRDELRSALAVGFGDLVGYTQLARRLPPDELAALVEQFETVAADVVAAGKGRLVKTLGDEVLFAAEEPHQAADIALELVDRLGAEPGMPEIRVGLAYGDVVTRMGDVFGTTVNLASRLTFDRARAAASSSTAPSPTPCACTAATGSPGSAAVRCGGSGSSTRPGCGPAARRRAARRRRRSSTSRGRSRRGSGRSPGRGRRPGWTGRRPPTAQVPRP